MPQLDMSRRSRASSGWHESERDRARMDCGVSQFPGSVDADPWGSVLSDGPPRAGPPTWTMATPWRAPQNAFPKRQSPGAKEGSLYRALPETPVSDISVNQQARRTQSNRGHKHHRIDGALTAAQVSTPIGIH